MRDKIGAIAGSTMIPAGFVLALMGVNSTFTETKVLGKANAREILEMKEALKNQADDFQEIRIRLTHIEDALGVNYGETNRRPGRQKERK